MHDKLTVFATTVVCFAESQINRAAEESVANRLRAKSNFEFESYKLKELPVNKILKVLLTMIDKRVNL